MSLLKSLGSDLTTPPFTLYSEIILRLLLEEIWGDGAFRDVARIALDEFNFFIFFRIFFVG
jgi:hypothetical protein